MSSRPRPSDQVIQDARARPHRIPAVPARSPPNRPPATCTPPVTRALNTYRYRRCHWPCSITADRTSGATGPAGGTFVRSAAGTIVVLVPCDDSARTHPTCAAETIPVKLASLHPWTTLLPLPPSVAALAPGFYCYALWTRPDQTVN